jgi:hypothetical protein
MIYNDKYDRKKLNCILQWDIDLRLLYLKLYRSVVEYIDYNKSDRNSKCEDCHRRHNKLGN